MILCRAKLPKSISAREFVYAIDIIAKSNAPKSGAVSLDFHGKRAWCRNAAPCTLNRVDLGAGYRVYYAVSSRRVTLLLCGGDQCTQNGR